MVVKLKLLLHQAANRNSNKLFFVSKRKKLKVCFFFKKSDTSKAKPQIEVKKPLSSTPGNIKKMKVKRNKAPNPEDVNPSNLRRVDWAGSDAIKMTADMKMEAAALIVNCMTELRQELNALSNSNSTKNPNFYQRSEAVPTYITEFLSNNNFDFHFHVQRISKNF